MLKNQAKIVFSNVWTIPNILTILRLLLIPVFAVLFFCISPKAAFIAFITASLTDLLDGFLARRLHQVTAFGKLFDPLADKLMVLTALVCQGIAGVLPWSAIGIVGAKEVVMVAGGLYMLSQDFVVYSNLIGKSAQVFFIASLILSFFHEELAAWGTRLDLILLWISVGIALLAMTIYVTQSTRQVLAKWKREKEQKP